MSGSPPTDQQGKAPSSPSRAGRRWAWVTRDRIRTAGVFTVLGLALALFAWVANQHFPLRHWLVFLYARYWLFALLFSAASLTAGLRILGFILPEPPRPGERLTLGFAVGVLVFALGVFLGGLAGLYGSVFFFAWPAVMLAFGARSAWQDLRRMRGHLRRLGPRHFLPGGPVELLAAILLLFSLVAIYLQVITPLNVGGDSYWYHLPIAEHYTATGAIRPFAEGWYLGAYPHLASILYTWAFQSPGELFDHVALSSHLEWTLFLATLPGVSALARRLAGTRMPYAAAAVFLFPGIFLYDSSLITGADHILAFWVPALGLALLRLGRRFTVREAVLAGTLTAACVLTKYTGTYLFVPTALLVLFLAIRTRRMGPLVAWGVAFAMVSSAHWLKNWIFYGDPLYPMLNKYLAVRPFHEGAADRMYRDPQFLLRGTFWEKVYKTLAVLVNFSFVPHDWNFHGDRPIFGSLFTLLIPVLLFLRARWRLWLMIVGVHVGIVVWFVTHFQDRYLQALVPWMAACTAAMLVLAWRRGIWVRCALVALVGFQILWGADVYFIRAHAMIGDSPLKLLIDHIGAGQQGRYDDRRRLHFGSLQSVGERLPVHAKVLVHERHDRLGLGKPSIHDSISWQGAVDYMVIDTPQAADELWRKLGATHVMWWHDADTASPEGLAREAVFGRAIDQWGDGPEIIGDKRLSKLMEDPRDRTHVTDPTKIAWLGCGYDPPLGMYTVRGLVNRNPESRLAEDSLRNGPLDALRGANAVVVRPSCAYLAAAMLEIPRQFRLLRQARDLAVWVRR